MNWTERERMGDVVVKEGAMFRPAGIRDQSSQNGASSASNRRGFIVQTLGATATLFGLGACTKVDAAVSPGAAAKAQGNQPRWRYCVQCWSLFFNGWRENKGACSGAPAGQAGHRAAGHDFVLSYNVPATSHSQADWRNCWKCQVLFFSGHSATQGVCPAGGAHEGHADDPKTFNLVIPYNVKEGVDNQGDWRNCWKCQVMFFNGYPRKGVCPAGGAHEGHADDPKTFNFVLPHPVTLRLTLQKAGDHVNVIGYGFTPESDVVWTYNYRQTWDRNELVSNADSPARSRSNADGNFTGAFAAFTSGGDRYFFVSATDVVSGHGTIAQLD